jgi:hypothetical protein
VDEMMGERERGDEREKKEEGEEGSRYPTPIDYR